MTLEVIGVARTAKYHSLSEPPTPFIYLPLKQSAARVATLFVVTTTAPASFGAVLRREFDAVDANGRVYELATMTDHIRRGALVVERLVAEIMTAVSVVGLILCAIGLYGTVAYSVSRRTHEIGIRMAIGATRLRVLSTVLVQGLKMSGAGIVFGVTIAALLSSLLGVVFNPPNSSAPDPNGPLIYIFVVVFSLAVTGCACYLPARRAAMVDPNVALRCD